MKSTWNHGTLPKLKLVFQLRPKDKWAIALTARCWTIATGPANCERKLMKFRLDVRLSFGYVDMLWYCHDMLVLFLFLFFPRISTLVFNRCYSRKKICQVWLSWSLLIRPGSHVRGDFAKTLWGRPRQRGGSVRLAHLEGQMKIVRTLSLKNASIYIHRSESRWRNSQKVA